MRRRSRIYTVCLYAGLLVGLLDAGGLPWCSARERTTAFAAGVNDASHAYAHDHFEQRLKSGPETRRFVRQAIAPYHPAWTHQYRTTHDTTPLREMPHIAVKYAVQGSVFEFDRALASLDAVDGVARILETHANHYLRENGIVLVEPECGVAPQALWERLTQTFPKPAYVGRVFSWSAEPDPPTQMQCMLLPLLYVSQQVTTGSQDIAHLLQAYGGRVRKVYDMPVLGLRGYVVQLNAEDDLFEMAELFSADPHVRAAAPEFLGFQSPLASCPTFPPAATAGCGCANEGEDFYGHFCLWNAQPPETRETSDPLHNPHMPSCYMKGHDDLFNRWGLNLHLVNVPAAWKKTTGSPEVRVAVLDTGVGPHTPDEDDPRNEFRGVLAEEGFDAIYCEDEYTDLNVGSHGTSVAGIIAALRNNGHGIAGIAGGDGGEPGCTIVPVRAVTAITNADVTNYALRLARAIHWVANDGDAAPRAQIANISLGGLSSSQALIDAVQHAHAKGVILIAAAQNYDIPLPSYPARYPEVVAVGGLTYDPNAVHFRGGVLQWKDAESIGMHRFYGHVSGIDPRAEPVAFAAAPSGSTYGPAVDISAISVLTAAPVAVNDPSALDVPLHAHDGAAYPHGELVDLDGCARRRYAGYGIFGATSCATPHVSGIAALMLSYDRQRSANDEDHVALMPFETVAMLKASARDVYYRRAGATPGIFMSGGEEIAGAGRDVFTGYGLVDAGAAMQLVEQPRFHIENQAGEVVASFFADGTTGGESYTLEERHGPIDYGDDGDFDAELRPRAIPNAVQGGVVEGNGANGALALRGVLTPHAPGTSLVPQTPYDFVVFADLRGEVPVARIDAEGNGYFKGGVHQYPWAPGEGSAGAFPLPEEDVTAAFALYTNDGDPYAFISSDGHLYLRGGLFEAGRPDPGASGERLVCFEDFEEDPKTYLAQDADAPSLLEARGWSLGGDWTHTRFAQYTATMTGAGWRSVDCGAAEAASGTTRHTDGAFGQVTIDNRANDCGGGGPCATFIIGTKSGDLLRAGTPTFSIVAESTRDAASCFTLTGEGVDGQSFLLERALSAEAIAAHLNGETHWRFDAVTERGHRMGGWANGWRTTDADGFHLPNRFVALDSGVPTAGHYLERSLATDGRGEPLDWLNNSGFTIDLHYQIVRDGTTEDRPGFALELYEAASERPVIRIAVEHYTDREGIPMAQLVPHVDWNRDPRTELPGERPGDDFEDTFNRAEGPLAGFAPRLLREVVWYELVLFADQDPADGHFRVGALLKLEGVQIVPVYWESATTHATLGAQPFNLDRIRLEVTGDYPEGGAIHFDDITVTQAQQQ